MSYTSEERKMIANAFRHCRKFLWDGKLHTNGHEFICWALETTRMPCWTLARKVVMDRLAFCEGSPICVDDYLIRVLKVRPEQLLPKDVQSFRHRWVKHLIKEFSQ